MIAPPALAQEGAWSFRLVSGAPAMLAVWLCGHGYSSRPIRNSVTWAARLERGPAQCRAIVLIYASGAVLIQGGAQPRQEAAALLCGLVVGPQLEQLELFSEVRS